MIDGKKLLAIIPARGGSKRLPGKNILPIGGKPMIAWTIEAAKKSVFIDQLIVSTDSPDIADLSKSYGAEVPFLRPDDLSSDRSRSVDVVTHALAELEKQKENFDYILLLQPTSPCRMADDIDGAVNLLCEKKAIGIISVCETDHHPLWCNQLPADDSMEKFLSDEVKDSRSQDMAAFFRINGAIYLFSVAHVLECKSLSPDEGVFAYKMPRQRSIDIDEVEDVVLAEYFLKDFE